MNNSKMLAFVIPYGMYTKHRETQKSSWVADFFLFCCLALDKEKLTKLFIKIV